MPACGNIVLQLLGDVESTEPTKILMRIAEHVDTGPNDLRDWFMQDRDAVLDMLAQEQSRIEGNQRKFYMQR